MDQFISWLNDFNNIDTQIGYIDDDYSKVKEDVLTYFATYDMVLVNYIKFKKYNELDKLSCIYKVINDIIDYSKKYKNHLYNYLVVNKRITEPINIIDQYVFDSLHLQATWDFDIDDL